MDVSESADRHKVGFLRLVDSARFDADATLRGCHKIKFTFAGYGSMLAL